jgi:hypothetical protein
VGVLSAKSTGGAMLVTEADALTVGAVSLSVNRVAVDGTTATTGTDVSQEDLVSGADLVLVTLNGGITTTLGTGEITAAADVLLSAGETVEATVADIVLNATLVSGGHISVIAKDGVALNDATADVTTAGGTVDVRADAGVAMVDGSVITSGGGAVRVQAAGGDVTIGGLSSQSTAADAISVTSLAGASGWQFSLTLVGTESEKIDLDLALGADALLAPQLQQPLAAIAQQLSHPLHQLFAVGADPFRPTHRRQHTRGLAAHHRAACHREHRHAHPQRIGGGGAARIRKRIQG